MVAYTTTYSFAKPTVGDDEDVWGGYLNGNFDSIEALLNGTTALTTIDVTGNITVGGTVDGVDIAARDLVLTSTTSTANAALPKAGGTMTGAITFVAGQTFDGRDVSADGAKLDGIEAGATADQTKADIDALGIAASTADTLATARNIALTGDVSGSANFDGSANVSITATVADDSHNHVISNIDGLQTALDGKLSTTGKAADSNLLDGIDSSAFLRSNTADTFTTLSGTQLNLGSQVQLAESSDRADLLQISSSTSGWAGLQIRNTSNEGRWSFMTDGNTAGIYDDENNDWHVYMTENAGVELRYNGVSKFNTTSTGANVTGTLTTDGLTVDGTTTLNGTLTLGANVINDVEDIYLRDKLFHDGDTDTYLGFGGNTINLVTGGGNELQIGANYVRCIDAALQEDYDALSGTSVTVDPNTGGAWSLTMTGNTTFTFGGFASGWSTGFILEVTGNGGTITWPASVDWAGGTAPDAPARGETDIYVFWSRNGGTTWYGVQSIDAAA